MSSIVDEPMPPLSRTERLLGIVVFVGVVAVACSAVLVVVAQVVYIRAVGSCGAV